MRSYPGPGPRQFNKLSGVWIFLISRRSWTGGRAWSSCRNAGRRKGRAYFKSSNAPRAARLFASCSEKCTQRLRPGGPSFNRCRSAASWVAYSPRLHRGSLERPIERFNSKIAVSSLWKSRSVKSFCTTNDRKLRKQLYLPSLLHTNKSRIFLILVQFKNYNNIDNY